MSLLLDRRFRDSTRGKIVSLLRAGGRTVDELAVALKLTDNAIRQHLSPLERDGLVRHLGVRRMGSVGKPAVVYELHPDTEPLFSRAYAPVLASLLEVLTEELPPRQVLKVLREAGRRIARDIGTHASGDLRARARAAAAVLAALGGDVAVENGRGVATLLGRACPLAMAASRSPHPCAAVESLVAEISGAKVTECCDRSGRPQCRFELRSAG